MPTLGKRRRSYSYSDKRYGDASSRISSVSNVQQDTELGEVDLAYTVTLNTTASVKLLNNIAVGNASYNRRGRQVQMKGLRVLVNTYPNSHVGSPVIFYVKMALVYDRQPNRSIPTYDDIFKGLDTSGIEIIDVYQFPNKNNKDRFVILKTWECLNGTFDFDDGIATFNHGIFHNRRKMFPIDEYIKVPYVTTYGKDPVSPPPITDIPMTGSLYMVCVSDDPSGLWHADVSVRLTYKS